MTEKRNKFILTGAGFSIPFMEFEDYTLNTGFLTDLITDEKTYKYFISKIYGEGIKSEYLELIEITKNIYDSLVVRYNENKSLDYPNFESVIYLCETISNYTDSTTFSKDYSSDNKIVLDTKFVELLTHKRIFDIDDDILDKHESNAPYKFKRNLILKIALELNEEFKIPKLKFRHVFFLKELILDTINLFTVKSAKKELLKNYFRKLFQEYNLKYYSLNYDSLIIDILTELYKENDIKFDELNTGSRFSDYGEIKGSNIFKNRLKKPHSLFFLHGSIFYNKISKNFTLDFGRKRKPNRGNKKYNLLLQGQQDEYHINPDGSFRYNLSMITGMNKETKLSHEPYSGMFAKCKLDFHDSDEVAILGYSFSDSHINSIIKNITEKHSRFDVVDFKPKPKENKNGFGNHTKEFRLKFHKLMKDSCSNPPTDENKNKKNSHILTNSWMYQLDKTSSVLYFNGVEEYIKKYIG